jgi:hypothetical protein
MSVIASKQNWKDPNDPVQTLRTKQHGLVKVSEKFWMGGVGVGKIIVMTPEGGYRFARGGPITDRQQIIDVIPPGLDQDKALNWWDTKDTWQQTAPRKINFQMGTGYPIYEDTGEFVESEDALLTNWPGDSPVFWAAVKALGKRQEAIPEPKTTLGLVQGGRQPGEISPEEVMQRAEAERRIEAQGPPTPPEPKPPGKGKPFTKAQLEKARATKAAKLAAKKAAAATE